jgi:hypothetical protein
MDPLDARHLVEAGVEAEDLSDPVPLHHRHVKRVAGREPGVPEQDRLGALDRFDVSSSCTESRRAGLAGAELVAERSGV